MLLDHIAKCSPPSKTEMAKAKPSPFIDIECGLRFNAPQCVGRKSGAPKGNRNASKHGHLLGEKRGAPQDVPPGDLAALRLGGCLFG